MTDEDFAKDFKRVLEQTTYNFYHRDLLWQHRAVLRSAFPEIHLLYASLEADMPRTYREAAFYTRDMFDRPGSMEKIPEQGRQYFVCAALCQHYHQEHIRITPFANLFGTLTDLHLGSAIVALTGEPRYLNQSAGPFSHWTSWKEILGHSPTAYRFLSPSLRGNLILARQVCRLVPSLYQYATGAAKGDFELARDVCHQDGLLLGYCNDTFAADYRIVSIALEQNRGAALYISGDFLRRPEQFIRVQNLLEMVHLSPAALQHDQVLLNFIATDRWDGDAVEVELALDLCRYILRVQGDILEACAAYFCDDPELPRVTRDIVPPYDELLVRRIACSSDGPTYSLWHHELLVSLVPVLRDVFPDLDQLCAIVETEKPINIAASEAFTEELFDDPSSIERGDALPERGRDLFIYLSLHEFKRRNPGASLVFENLFGSVTNAHVGSAIVRLTGEPRYVTRNDTQ